MNVSDRKRRYVTIGALAALSLGLGFFSRAPGHAAAAATPGTRPSIRALLSPRPGDPLLPFFSDSGLISLSLDGIGTNDPAGAPLRVHKNVAGATVREAFLFAASTGFSNYTPVTGDVTLDGTPIAWNPANTLANDIGSVNVEADVTALVKAKVDPAPAGEVIFTCAEPLNTLSMDGEILAVILDDPSVTRPGSVALLYGAQNPAGDTFHVALANPVDKTDPHFALDLSLGISYGYQPTGQFSTVDVNGNRMTSAAGGQDDCVDKYSISPDFPLNCLNGTLITVGGIGDTNGDPANPSDTDLTCGSAPRCDDELYSLLPFVNNGDTSLTFNTTNPSNDDNIFFAALDVRSSAALVGSGIVLSPTAAANDLGQPHTLTATVQDDNGNPLPGVTVHFEVTSGPNMGTSGDAVTNAQGQAQFTYTSSTAGTDTIVASFTDAQSQVHTSNQATKTWGPHCGNGIVDIDEDCDPPGSITCPEGSPAGAFLACQADCTCPAAVTTTTVISTTSTSTTSTSTTSTTVPVCGDGFVESGEQCDPPGPGSAACGGSLCTAICQCCVSTGPEAGHCGDMIDNDCNGLVDCADMTSCKPHFCVGGNRDGGSCETTTLTKLCEEQGGTCQCPDITHDPTRIIFGERGMARDLLISHGRLADFGPRLDVAGSELGWVLSNGHGKIFSAVLPPRTLIADRSGKIFRYSNPLARTAGGISKVLLRITRSGTSYGYRVEAYGDMSGATDPSMALQFYIGNQPTPSIHAASWERERYGWRTTVTK